MNYYLPLHLTSNVDEGRLSYRMYSEERIMLGATWLWAVIAMS